MTKWLLPIASGLVAIQLVQFPRTNPPVAGELAAPAEVKAILRRACYDCHSNETTLPWFDRIFGTHYLPRKQLPSAYGIEAKLPDSLGGQLIYPLLPPQALPQAASTDR